MTKTPQYDKLSKAQTITLLWIVGLLPIFWLALILQGIFEVGFTSILLLVSFIIPILISIFLPSKKRNLYGVLSAGLIPIFINFMFVLDFWNEAKVEATCGSGFSAGNCFLFDGLGVLIYFIAIPIGLIVSNTFLTINLSHKYQSKK